MALAARKDVPALRPACGRQPRHDRFTSLLGNLELNRMMALLLHDRRPCQDIVTVGNVTDTQADDIAATQFVVDAKIDQR